MGNKARLIILVTLLFCSKAFTQPGSQNFNKVWVQGESDVFTTTFNGAGLPDNQLLAGRRLLYFAFGHSTICDSNGNILLISDGFSLYGRNLNVIDGGNRLVPYRIYRFEDGWSNYSQSSIILPFSNGKYRLITPTTSDDSCVYNWEQVHNRAFFDLLLYDEIDMNANGGAGKVTRRMEPMLQNVRLSKTQMMACRHGDGSSWWLFKQAADTNLIYKFLLTDDRVYGPYLQGLGENPLHFGSWDHDCQAMFSKDGTKYATAIQGYGKVLVADFDRCSGMLSNPKVYKVPARPIGDPASPAIVDSSTNGICFSPNGRYLYVSGYDNIQQLDLQNPSTQNAWTWLSGPDTTWDQFQQYSNIYPGADGKLYVGNWGGLGGQMSVIDAPDSAGTAAGFCRKCLRFPGFIVDTTFRFIGVSGPPCMPNYALGPTNPRCTVGVPTPASPKTIFRLYPNPASATLNIDYSEAGELSIYDITNRLLKTVSLSGAAGSRQVSMADMPAGMCICRYYVEGSLKEVQKIIVLQGKQ